MKERPILFSGAMVRAILEGSKTQTRRVCVPRYDDRKPCEHFEPELINDKWYMQRHCEHGTEGRSCPLGQAGDRLWVRETFASGWCQCPWIRMPHKMKPDGTDCAVWREAFERDGRCQPSWKPSIFMPRWASRINLEITAVRVERLQDISEDDAKEEGASNQIPCGCITGTRNKLSGATYEGTFLEGFRLLWDSINGNRKDKHGNRLPYSWNDNPWVWVVGFRRVENEK